MAYMSLRKQIILINVKNNPQPLRLKNVFSRPILSHKRYGLVDTIYFKLFILIVFLLKILLLVLFESVFNHVFFTLILCPFVFNIFL